MTLLISSSKIGTPDINDVVDNPTDLQSAPASNDDPIAHVRSHINSSDIVYTYTI